MRRASNRSPAGGQDDVADLDGQDLVLLIEVDGVGRAEFLAGLAGALDVIGAVDIVDDRVLGHGLREGSIDRLAVSQAGLEDIVDDFLRAFLPADAAAGAVLGLDIAGALLDGDGEIADIPIHFLDLGIGQQGDVGVVANLNHLGCQDAGRAVEGGEGLVKLGHMPADGRFALHQVDRESRVRDFQGSLDAGDPATHDQRGRVDGHAAAVQALT